MQKSASNLKKGWQTLILKLNKQICQSQTVIVQDDVRNNLSSRKLADKKVKIERNEWKSMNQKVWI